MAQDYRTLKLEVLAETKQFVKGMNDANKETESFGDKLGDFSKKAGAALAVVGAAAGAMAIKVGKEAVQAASDLAESTSKVGVIFGTVSEEITKFAAQAASSLGQTRIQAQNAASTFATFGKAAGLSGKDLSNFSIEFVKLASDIASFNNTSVDQAINALGAALRGESEPIRAYGVLLNDATLKAKAMEMGLYDGKGALDAQTKVLAAHQVVLAQTQDAQGDFARTADGMANSQKILTARLEEAKITLGQALLPVALEAVNLFNDKFLPVIQDIAGAFSNEGGSGLNDRIRDFVTEGKDFLEPIVKAVRDAFDNFSKVLKDNKDNFDAVGTAVKDVYDFFRTYMVPLLKGQAASAIEGIGTAFVFAAKVIGPIIGTIGKLISGIVNIIDSVVSKVISLANSAIGAVNTVIEAYNKIPLLPDIDTIPKISTKGGSSGSNTVSSSSLPSGFTAAVESLTSGAVASVASVSGGSIPSVSSSGGTSGGGSSKGSASKPELTLIEEVTQENFIDSLQTVFDVAGFRRGEEADRNIVINVNSPSVIDENGFAAAVAAALNNTQRRTGGGLGVLVD
jgi:hypothetical protein